MKTLIATNDAGHLRTLLGREACRGGAFLDSARCYGSGSIREYLLSLGLTEVDLREASLEYADGIKREFSRSVAAMNDAHGSPEWWAMSFTDKNPLSAPLFGQIFCSHVVMELLGSGGSDAVIVLLTDDAAILEQLELVCKNRGIRFSGKISGMKSAKGIFRACTPVGILITLFKIIARKAVPAMAIGSPAPSREPVTAVISQFIDRSISADYLYRDVYMTGIQEMLARRGVRTITAGFVSCGIFRFIGSLRRNKANRDIYPIEYFVSWRDLAKACIVTVRRYVARTRAVPPLVIFGVDYSLLLEREMRSAVLSGQLLINLVVKSAAYSLARRFSCERAIVPFENRSWEKMVIMGFREASPKTVLLGYQHAAVTQNHINFLFEDGECDRIPFPDRVITMGPAISRILSSDFNVPRERLRSGCALRQRLPAVIPSRKRRRIVTIMAALASSIEEYNDIIDLFESVAAEDRSVSIVIRPHPAFALEAALKLRTAAPGFAYEKDVTPLYGSLNRVDVVVYASSTVAIEALALGIPVVHVDSAAILSPDPLFAGAPLRWSCRNSGGLLAAIKEMEDLNDAEWEARSREARLFAESYCAPVTEECVDAFVT